MRVVIGPAEGRVLPMEAVGGKAAALAALAQRGHRVPPFFVIGTELYERTRHDPLVAAAEQALRDAGPGERSGRAARLRETIAHARVDERAWHAVVDAYRTRLGGGPVAVRSSAAEEDGAHRSYAGQYDSFLGVEGADALGRAVHGVWASAYGDRAIAYRASGGSDGGHERMAVIVQRMVAADSAGVLFTRDPTQAGSEHVVIAATRGLGDRLASGAIDGETVRVDRNTLSVSARDGEPVLDADEIGELARLGVRIERELGAPQDVEWAWAGDALYVLQARPITGAPARRTVWDNSNIVESYPGITLPLTFSLARESYEAVYRQAAELAGLSPEAVAAHGRELARMIGLVHGRVYYDLVSWYTLLSLFPGFGHNRAFMEQMMGVRESLALERSRPRMPLIRTTALLARMAALGLTMDGRVAGFERMVDTVCGEYERAGLGDRSAADLVARYEDLKRRIRTEWKAPILNDFLTMLFFGLLRRLIARWHLDRDGLGIHNDLLRGIGGVRSVEPAHRIVAIARLVGDDPSLRAFYAERSDGELAVLLRERHLPAALGDAIRSYLARYGHRSAQELKLEYPSLGDDPAPLFAAIRTYVDRPDVDIAAAEQRDRDARTSAEARVRSALGRRAAPRVLLFSWVLARTRRHVRDREEMRFARGRVFGVARELFTGLGRRLAESGRLDRARDVFYLTVDEVCAAARGAAEGADLRSLVAERTAEFDRYRAEPPLPDRFEGDPPAPDAARSSAPAGTGDATLSGLGCCAGVVRGLASVVSAPDGPFRPGDILVARETDPSWVTLFPLAAGILVERGSLLSHSAIVARELGVPAIVGIRGLTATVRGGDRVEMDGGRGVIRMIDVRGPDHAAVARTNA